MQNTNFYDSVHFEEYLDGGSFDLPGLNIPECVIVTGKQPGAADWTDNKGTDPKIPTDTPRYWYICQLSTLCERYFQMPVINASFPGGENRNSCRLHLQDGRSVIATRRDAPGRARLEDMVLSKLHTAKAPVPANLGFNGVVLIQEDLQGARFSDLLFKASPDDFESLMKKALSSLSEIHQIAHDEGLHHYVPLMGADSQWLVALLDRTAVIGNYLHTPCSPLPVSRFLDLLTLINPGFVKWDARPGNAILDSDNEIKWFDWEHCCLRNPIDDMVWLLCDDSIPDFPDIEDNLIEQYLGHFANGKSYEEAHAYLRVFGLHHMCVRLGRILDEKGNGPWHEVDQNIKYGVPGLALGESIRLCKRGARWADKLSLTRPLAGWFEALSVRLRQI